MPRGKRRPSGPSVVAVPEGYTLIRTDELMAILREASMTARLAAAIAQHQERALVNGLLPTLKDGIGDFMRAHAKRSEVPHV